MKPKDRCLVLALVVAIIAAVGCAFGLLYVTVITKMDDTIATGKAKQTSLRKPNIIILIADDIGYGDLRSYGNPIQEWTGMDRMAKEGMKFTHWSTPVSMCSPSRAALLTGRYPIRTGVFGREKVFGPASTGGLPASEITMAEALKDAGYKTGLVGKWHLGVNAYNSSDGSHLPKHHGFDYVGINLPQSQVWFCDPKKYTVQEMRVCFLYNNDKIIEQPINHSTLTSRLVQDAKNFLSKNKDDQFFLYLAFPQAHMALFASPRFAGSSKRGPFGDTLNEMGWAVDELLDHLIDLGIEKDTLVTFLSDHGPISDGCGQGGTMGPFRGGKTTTWEGGVRIPAVAWWPGKIAPGSVDDSAISVMDVFPTALKLAGVDNSSIISKLHVDGKSIHKILQGQSDGQHHETLFYYCDQILSAVRYGKYKIHYYTTNLPVDIHDLHGDRRHCHFRDYKHLQMLVLNTTCEKLSKKHDPPLVFDVEADPEELVLVDTSKPEIQQILDTVEDIVETHKVSIVPVESEVNKPNNRSVIPCCNPPLCQCNYNAPATRPN